MMSISLVYCNLYCLLKFILLICMFSMGSRCVMSFFIGLQFSPTSEHLLLAYGRRHSSLLKSVVIGGDTTVPIYTILEVSCFMNYNFDVLLLLQVSHDLHRLFIFLLFLLYNQL